MRQQRPTEGIPTDGADVPSVVACATALPAASAILRLSGPQAAAIARTAGLTPPHSWTWHTAAWELGPGVCPVHLAWYPAGRSYTGFDTLEIHLPGAPDLIDLALEVLYQAGAQAADAGRFTRMALASGRIDLPTAEAVLAVVHAGDAAAAARALEHLRGGISADLAPLRARFLALRAAVEAGLDFLDEDDVRAYDPDELHASVAGMRGVIARWQRTAMSEVGYRPLVALVGPANAGKSALFAALTGSDVLVSPVAGTTRDHLEADWTADGRAVRLVDTAGWLAQADDPLDSAALAAGAAQVAAAAVVVVCVAPDAPLPLDWQATIGRQALVVATKADLGPVAIEAALTCSSQTGAGLEAVTARIASELAECGGNNSRQQARLAECLEICDAILQGIPEDPVLADQLRRAADALGDLIGVTTPDDVLDLVFSQFCIGK